jgi:hypothetical protein
MQQQGEGDGNPESETMEAVEQGSEETLPEQLPDPEDQIEGAILLGQQMGDAPDRERAEEESPWIDADHAPSRSM